MRSHLARPARPIPAGTSSRPRRPGRAAARVLAAAALPAVLATGLAACGDEDGTAAGGTAAAAEGIAAEHDEDDITFAQGMLPHHEQAVDMARTALDRAEDPEVVALAEEVAAAQEPEIRTLGAMLEAWGAAGAGAAGAAGMDGMDGMAGMDMDAHDEGAGAMPGMMSAEEMAALEEAEGAEFDRLWLTMMVEHHEGAVEMARTEVEEGANPQARELAGTIAETQEREIEQMQALLDG